MASHRNASATQAGGAFTGKLHMIKKRGLYAAKK
tara:strand:+ start:135 stop:236 length:102 start_codon:yes stop_codon:yes gene_type:complete